MSYIDKDDKLFLKKSGRNFLCLSRWTINIWILQGPISVIPWNKRRIEALCKWTVYLYIFIRCGNAQPHCTSKLWKLLPWKCTASTIFNGLSCMKTSSCLEYPLLVKLGVWKITKTFPAHHILLKYFILTTPGTMYDRVQYHFLISFLNMFYWHKCFIRSLRYSHFRLWEGS